MTGVTGAINEYAEEEQQMLDLINEERALYGLEPFSFNSVLNDAASEHSKEMIEEDYFSHDSYDGTSFSERLSSTGYDIVYAGENIALHYPPDLIAAHEGLMNSPGHRANILKRISIFPHFRSLKYSNSIISSHFLSFCLFLFINPYF
ncbi:CAP domain-containing protein [Methanolobus sp. ZRKC4]|uniref:CAP domain-containing protein n=1 Tax=Methanolobus sp. ZRKC4 TaxID=3125787 RepID=UPI0032511173